MWIFSLSIHLIEINVILIYMELRVFWCFGRLSYHVVTMFVSYSSSYCGSNAIFLHSNHFITLEKCKTDLGLYSKNFIQECEDKQCTLNFF